LKMLLCPAGKDTLNTHYQSTCPQFDTKLVPFHTIFGPNFVLFDTVCLLTCLIILWISAYQTHCVTFCITLCVILCQCHFWGGAHPLQIHVYTNLDKHSSWKFWISSIL
jgi:hypothetical protein